MARLANLELLPDGVLLRQAQIIRDRMVERARVNASDFNAFVLKDDKTGRSFRQADVHRRWHELMDANERVIIISSTALGKSSQVSVGRVLYQLGRNPDLRVAVVSNTAGQSAKTIRTLEKYIQQSAELHEVFPHLKPSEPWSTYQFSVERKSKARDASVQAFGLHGNVLGSRIDLLVMDDILDFESTRNERARQDTADWYHATLEGRLTADAHVWNIGNAWHPDDLSHKLHEEFGWPLFKFPIVDPETGESAWPEEWTSERIEKRKVHTPPAVWSREMLCQVRDDSEARFQRTWVEMCMRSGVGLSMPFDLAALPAEERPKGSRCFTGVDLGIGRNERNARTALFTGLVRPDGKRRPLCVEQGRWGAEEIVNRIRSHNERFGSVAIVENNAGQDFLLQFTRRHVPVIPFTTGRNKAHPEFGVEGIAAEMSRGEWIIPSTETREGHLSAANHALQAWISGLLFYNPAEHVEDVVMASWFFREGGRMGRAAPRWHNLDIMSR